MARFRTRSVMVRGSTSAFDTLSHCRNETLGGPEVYTDYGMGFLPDRLIEPTISTGHHQTQGTD